MNYFSFFQTITENTKRTKGTAQVKIEIKPKIEVINNKPSSVISTIKIH